MTAPGGAVRVRLRAGPLSVVVLADDVALLSAALGPLAVLEAPDATGRALAAIRIDRASVSRPRPPAGTPATEAVRWTGAGIDAPGTGRVELSDDGFGRLEVEPDAPAGDAVAERLLIPAIATLVRRHAGLLLHAACLLPPPARPGRAAWVVPASRGSGKTTLSLALRRGGFALLSDDRGFVRVADGRAWIDPWPEAPRVGARSLFLLPPHVVEGRADPATGKHPVPALTPPRLSADVPVAGVLLPRLVDGPGGTVTPARGAAALAAVASQGVVATDPADAARSLALVASFVPSLPAFHVEVGDDPATLAAEVLAAIRSVPRDPA